MSDAADVHPEQLANATPAWFAGAFAVAVGFVERNGWLMVAIGLTAYVLWNKYERQLRRFVGAVPRHEKDPVYRRSLEDQRQAAYERMQAEAESMEAPPSDPVDPDALAEAIRGPRSERRQAPRRRQQGGLNGWDSAPSYKPPCTSAGG